MLEPWRATRKRRHAQRVLAFFVKSTRLTQIQLEQRLAQLEQEQSEGLEAILRHLPAGVVIAKAPSGHVILANDEAKRIFALAGLHGELPDSSGPSRALHADGRPYSAGDWPLARALHQGETVVNEEVRIPRDASAETSVLVSSSPVRDKNGNVVAAVATLTDVTERRQAVQALQKSEARMAGIVSSAMDAIISVDSSQKIILFNAAAETMFRTPAAEAVGQPLDRFIPQRFRAGHQEHIHKFGATGVTTRGMGRLGAVSGLRSDGQEFPIEASISQLEVAGEKLYTVILRDISQRVEAERVLRRINRELRAISACNQALIRSPEESSLLLEVCQIIVQEGGYKMAWVGFAELDEDKTVRPMAWAGFEDGYLQQVKNTWADSPSGQAPSCRAIRTGAPQVARDIRTDPAFEPWRQFALARGFGACIGLPLLSDGRAFGSLNIYAAEPGGFADEEVRLLTEFASDLAYGIIALRTRAARDQAEAELQRQREHLEQLVQARTSALRATNDRLQEQMAQRERVQTTLRQSEAELQDKNRLLEAAVAAAQQAHRELQDAQGRLVLTEKLAALGQLVAGVAHEINNPLSFVHNNIVVLQRDVAALRDLLNLYRQSDALLDAQHPQLAAQVRELGGRIDVAYTCDNLDDVLVRSREGVRRIQRIVRDLRDFARGDENQPEQADLNAGIESTANIVGGLAKNRKVELRLELGTLPLIECFPAKINQVVMNLLSNAIDACPAEGGVVTVRTEADAKELRIAVEDNGHGMDPAVRDRIFDPFFTTKPQGKGMGMGLSISYGIVRDHGGTIDLQTSPGHGARFTVHLPRRASHGA
jgi:PAS domain S-box-containing protein